MCGTLQGLENFHGEHGHWVILPNVNKFGITSYKPLAQFLGPPTGALVGSGLGSCDSCGAGLAFLSFSKEQWSSHQTHPGLFMCTASQVAIFLLFAMIT